MAHKGFTLIELIISTVVLGLCVIPIALIHQEAMHGSYQTKVLTVATALAEEKMEETLILGFSGVASVASTSFASPFDDYSYQVTVHYVNGSDMDTSVDPTVTTYRNIEVQVSHSLIDQAVVLNSALTDY